MHYCPLKRTRDLLDLVREASLSYSRGSAAGSVHSCFRTISVLSLRVISPQIVLETNPIPLKDELCTSSVDETLLFQSYIAANALSASELLA